jgi:hypothetical protein
MLPESERKQSILDKCRKLKKYLASESQVGLLPYLEVLDAIEKRAQAAVEPELPVVNQELAQLMILLQQRDRGDGIGILNAEHWERLFPADDKSK